MSPDTDEKPVSPQGVMKLSFEPNLDFQIQAIESVCDIFKGQEVCRTEFTIPGRSAGELFDPAVHVGELGVGNRLRLLDDEVLRNLRAVQVKNGLQPSEAVDLRDLNFTVEMETGTGKTYVYLRTVFELNKRYGFTKFVIVVPSVAIREGVAKSLKMTAEHFRGLYAGAPFESFVYDSDQRSCVRGFALSPHIQVMVVTVGAINKKDVNNLYKTDENLQDDRPIDFIAATRPIVIVDEPQSVDGGLEGRGREALRKMAPLCTLRYSATHRDPHHMVYRLDAVDAYERKLVKQIEVASVEVEGAHNRAYVRVLGVKNARNKFTATLELDVMQDGCVSRKAVTVRPGDDLEEVCERAAYRGFKVQSISCKEGDEFVEFLNLEHPMRLGATVGEVDRDAVARLMIRRTIEAHLEKELRLAPVGIKILSLFFVESVEQYRASTEAGAASKGKYALMFEEEYRAAAARPKYVSLFREVDLRSEAAEVHEGYFSIDKKNRWCDTEEDNKTGRDNAERAYALIMRDKEKLLSFSTKLKFIFSHSALKEGWDNPNVFQVCALREMGSELQRRQSIGRGLRICVDQTGLRRRGEHNVLTVVANEGFEAFAAGLQKDYESEGVVFGVVDAYRLAAVRVLDASGNPSPLGTEAAERLMAALKEAGYVAADGAVQDVLRRALKTRTLVLPEEFRSIQGAVEALLKRLAGRLEIKNADSRAFVRPRKEVLASEEFRDLWERVKHKTTYRVKFDPERLIAAASEALRTGPTITATRAVIRTADLAIGPGGIEAVPQASGSAPVLLEERAPELPDPLSVLQDRTELTRKTLARILIGSGRLADFARNPQSFLEIAAEAILRTKRSMVVDGIRYVRLGDEHFWAQELFEAQELQSYLDRMLDSTKSPFEKVVYDSETVERPFAEKLEQNASVRVYAKLPAWFVIPTPLGFYNPDWAVLVEEAGGPRLYFVVETKPSTFLEDLRGTEAAKIRCGKSHFAALAVREAPASYLVAQDFDSFEAEVRRGSAR